jgi:hypothetical protein
MRRLWIGTLFLLLIAVTASHSATSYFYDSEQNPNNVFAASWPEILRPSGVGNSTENTPNGAGDNWQCVYEETSDGDSTYAQCESTSYLKDSYATQDHSAGSGTIDKVVINIRCRKVESALNQDAYAKTVIRTHDIDYKGGQITLPSSYAVYSTEYALNPNTGSAWTWSEIDALECGADLKSAQDTVWDYARCTQVWVAVHYTP